MEILYCLILIPTMLLSQTLINPGTIVFKSGKIIQCQLKGFSKNTVWFKSTQKSNASDLLVLQNICLNGTGVVYSESEEYLYSLDSLTNYSSKRKINSQISDINKDSSNKHEFSIAIGLLTTATFFEIVKAIVISFGATESTDYGSYQTHLGYRYFRNKHWIYGIDFSYEQYG